MQVRHQLDLGFGLLIVALATVAGLSVWSLSRAQHASAHLDNAFGQQVQLSRLLTAINQQMRELGEYVLTGDNDELEESRAYKYTALTAFEDWRQLIAYEHEHFDCQSEGRPTRELETWHRCHEEYAAMAEACERVIGLVLSGQRLQAIDLMEQQVEVLHDETIAATIQELIGEEDAEVVGVRHTMWQMYGRAWYLTLAVTIAALAGAALTSRLIVRNIARPLAKLGDAATRIGNGDFDTKIEVASDDDIGKLAGTLGQMAGQLKQNTVSIEELRREVGRRQHAERQLEAVNEELTHFAYIVSHDLKAPLRGVGLLVDWLCADYADALGPEGAKQLALLQNRVQRMHGLIDGILQYSRIGRINQTVEPIDLNELLSDIIDSLCPDDHVQVTIRGPLPTVTGEHTCIAQVFQNLISNAIKYMDKPRGQVTVACDEGPDAWTFSVTDNGPGIESKHFERIFQIFQTLAPKDEYESTGVGLTLVKKIVEQHGGAIWVTSEVGQGSTFYFTLPKEQPLRRPEPDESAGDADAKQAPLNAVPGSLCDSGTKPC